MKNELGITLCSGINRELHGMNHEYFHQIEDEFFNRSHSILNRHCEVIILIKIPFLQ